MLWGPGIAETDRGGQQTRKRPAPKQAGRDEDVNADREGGAQRDRETEVEPSREEEWHEKLAC